MRAGKISLQLFPLNSPAAGLTHPIWVCFSDQKETNFSPLRQTVMCTRSILVEDADKAHITYFSEKLVIFDSGNFYSDLSKD